MENILLIIKNWLPTLKDFVLMCTALIASYVGLKGLGTWRRQLKGNAEYELARQLLRSVYAVRDAINDARAPFLIYSQEPDMSEEKLKELSDKEKQWHAMAQAYQKKWEPVPKAKSSLDTFLLEAEVVWGQKIVALASPLNELIGDLLWAIQDHLESMNPKGYYENPGAEEVKKRKRIMYARGSDNKDEYKNKLVAVVKSIEEVLKPHIQQKHR